MDMSKVLAQAKLRGMSLKTLARESGLSYTAVRNYVKGRQELSLNSAIRIAKVLGCSLDYLFMPEPEVKPDPYVTILCNRLGVSPSELTKEYLEGLDRSKLTVGVSHAISMVVKRLTTLKVSDIIEI